MNEGDLAKNQDSIKDPKTPEAKIPVLQEGTESVLDPGYVEQLQIRADQAREATQQDQEELSTTRQNLDHAYTGEAGEAESRDTEKMSQKELGGLKSGLSNLADSVRGLFVGLRERDQGRLSPLIDPQNIDKLKSSAVSLKSLIEGKNIESEYLMGAIQKIIEAIDTVGEVSRKQGQLKENEDSLRKIKFLLSNVDERCKEIFRDLRKIEKTEAKSIASSVEKAHEVIGQKRNFIARRIVAFERYRS